MCSTGNGKSTNEIHEELGTVVAPTAYDAQNDIPLLVEHKLENEENTNEVHAELEPVAAPTTYGSQNDVPLLVKTEHGNIFWGKVKGLCRYVKFGSSSRSSSNSSEFGMIADEEQDMTSSDSPLLNQGSTGPSRRKINWASLRQKFKQWIRHPLNMVIFVGFIVLFTSGVAHLLLSTGMLDGVFPRKSQRDSMVEVMNQTINAIFTLVCLCQHPKWFYHLFLLCRWRSEDILKLREVYCKEGTKKPNERKHILVIVLLCHVNCFAQYAYAVLSVGFASYTRPALAAGPCLYVAISTGIIAGMYGRCGPLGKKYDIEKDPEAHSQVTST